MQKHLGKNKKALSSLSLLILLLIAAIIGGIISYIWVTGYYMSLKEKIPGQDTVAITNLSFNPQNATTFNVTLLNPSYSPSNLIRVFEIGYIGHNENTFHPVLSSIPSLSTPFNLTRGTSQTFMCKGDLTPYLNQTLAVSVFVVNGSGSTNFIKIPYTQLLIRKISFNSTIGVKNFTITLQNAPLSAANLTITTIGIDYSTQGAINTTLHPITPTLPYTLAPNKTVTLSLNYNWSSYAAAGGSHQISVLTKEGYSASNSTQVPKLAFSIQQINFNQTDTKHFAVTLKNEVSTNTPLNVSRIEVLMDNGTVTDATPPLNSNTNGVLGNSTATFTASWNWTYYRDRSVIVAIYTLQGVEASNKTTTPALSILNTTFPDSQHVFVTIKNSQYSAKVANVTKMTVTLENGTENKIQVTQPPTSPYLVGIGNETMFNAYWNWQTYLNKTVKVNIYTDEGLMASYTTRTPSSLANYTVYLTVPSAPVFNTANTTQFKVTVNNSQTSSGNATITKITVLLVNGTEIDTTFTPQAQTIIPNNNVTFTCLWNWATYRNKSIVILVYTNGGLKAIYVTKTAP
jgi:hypothetical protein